jgi:hypothetical protein
MWDDTVLDERIYPRGGVVVGAGARSDFATPDCSNLGLPPLFKLFRRSLSGWRLVLAPGMSGSLTLGREERSVDQILEAPEPKRRFGRGTGWRAVAIGPGDWGVVGVGNVSFVFSLTAPEGGLGGAPRTPLIYTRPSQLYSFTLHALLVGLTFLFSTWPPPGGSSLGGYVIHLSTHAPPPPVEKTKAAGTTEGAPKEKPAATAGKEGKSGGEGKKPRASQSSPKPNPSARDEIVKRVETQGVLKFQGSLSKIAGPSQEDARLASGRCACCAAISTASASANAPTSRTAACCTSRTVARTA